MNKAKLQEKADAMQKELDALKAEINKPECVDIFKQRGVWYNVWDDGDCMKGVQSRKLHSFNNSGDFQGLLSKGEMGVYWSYHEISYPQWIDIPDDMMTDPMIKGRYLIELNNGKVAFSEGVTELSWDVRPNYSNRIKRVCILEKQ